MNYISWNNLIGRFFFNENNFEKEIFLYITKQDIIELCKKENGAEFENDFEIWQSFTSSLRNGPPGSHGDIIDRTINCFSRRNRITIDGQVIQIPLYFLYLISFILPLTEGEDDLNPNNYYDRLNNFLQNNNILRDANIRTNRFKTTDSYWSALAHWSNETNGGALGNYKVKNFGGHRYVGKPFAECILTSNQKMRFPELFSEADLRPDDNLTDIEISDILNKYGQQALNININKWRSIIDNNLLSLIIPIFRQELKSWQSGEMIFSNGSNEELRYQRKKLIISLSFSDVSQTVLLRYFRILMRSDFPEELIINNHEIIEIENGYSSPILNETIDLNSNTQIRSLNTRKIFTFQARNYYIFYKNRGRINDWLQIDKIEPYCTSLIILVKVAFFQELLNDWNNVRIIEPTNSNIPIDWKIIYVQNIIVNQHPRLESLKIAPEFGPTISFTKSIFFNYNFYKDLLPKVWCENFLVEYIIQARYEDGILIPLTQEDDFFTFNDQHIAKANKFKLICGEIETHNFYGIKDFEKLPNNEIEQLLPKKDILGRVTENNYFIKGNELFGYTLNTQQYNNTVIFNNRYNEEIPTICDEYSINHKGNIFLHYLSEKGKLTHYEIKKILTDFLDEGDINKEKSRICYRLQELGYIDFNAHNGDIFINKPQAVIIPGTSGRKSIYLTGARDPLFINQLSLRCSPYADIFISNPDYPLLPQRIEFQITNNLNFNHVRTIFNNLNILFQPNALNIQYALSSIMNEVDLTDLEMANPNLIHSNYRRSKFDLQQLRFIPDENPLDSYEMALIKNEGINGHKNYYILWDNGFAYEVPERNLGVYLLLWLNNRQLNQNLNVNVIKYSSRDKKIAVPIACSFPKYLSIAICLLSGESPVIEIFDNKPHLLYQNVPSDFAHNLIARTVNQILILK